MDGGTPGMWNQLRFNVDQAPSLANLVSHVTSRRPGAVLLGPPGPPDFTVVDPATLAIAQRLARRDVARMREPRKEEEEEEEERQPQQERFSRSPSPPARPVSRPCRRERERQQQQEARLRQREKNLQHRRPLPPAQPRKHAVQLASLPARGESPPMRDTDPQPNYPVASKAMVAKPKVRLEQQQQLAEARAEMREIRAQHQQMLAALRNLAKSQSQARASPTPSDRSHQSSGRPRVRLQTRRTKLWGGPAPSTRPGAKPSRQPPSMPANRRPRAAPQKKAAAAKAAVATAVAASDNDEEAEEEEVLPFRAPRLLNKPSPRNPASAEGILEEVRRLLLASRAAEPKETVEMENEAEEDEDDISEAESLPGCELGLPTLEEMTHRMDQIEADADAIRERWRTLQFEDVEEEVLEPTLPFENRAMLFTKLPAGPGAEGKKQPRPPTTVPVSVPRPAARSIEAARQRFLDWNADRPGPRFSVELPLIADWIAEDLVEELLLESVSDIDRAGEEIVQLLLEGEMTTERSDSGGEEEEEEDEEESDFDASDASEH